LLLSTRKQDISIDSGAQQQWRRSTAFRRNTASSVALTAELMRLNTTCYIFLKFYPSIDSLIY